MRIGIDFDNTIACYDGVFHAAAVERGLVPETIATDKNSVRDHLNGQGKKDAFTELQGYVYGARMDLARTYEGVIPFIQAARENGHDVFIVSHKTKFPMMGEPYDLHAAARGFLEANNLLGDAGVLDDDKVHFEVTKEDKIARAVACGVDLFVDDLPEILTMAGWNDSARRFLFAPNGYAPRNADQPVPFTVFDSWQAIHDEVLSTNAV